MAFMLLQQVAQSAPPPGPPPGFSTREAFFELVQFVGWFLSVGAIGFRYAIVRRMRGMSDEARTILRPDNAALLGIVGVVLLLISYLGGPWKLALAAYIIPRSVRDYLYDQFAKRRYRWFGKHDVCPLPLPDVRERFLD